ncbi:hypothetical protein NDU88_007602 [Pleurodeles waltl]|uniref:Uncharacterized protein n=1 Tax=Pleurodeles waltl TaxID=8319 RepID=A0AAV7PLT1_PLEWA|nr:hypothetical protein NDU88_007602 [Pleurodeles waltl]
MSAQILAAIELSCSMLEHKIDTLSVERNLIRSDLRKIDERSLAMEKEGHRLTAVVMGLKVTTHLNTDRTLRLEDKMRALEDKSRQSNLHFIRFPKNVEGSAPKLFLDIYSGGPVA